MEEEIESVSVEVAISSQPLPTPIPIIPFHTTRFLTINRQFSSSWIFLTAQARPFVSVGKEKEGKIDAETRD
jgi:hypothetical protein